MILNPHPFRPRQETQPFLLLQKPQRVNAVIADKRRLARVILGADLDAPPKRVPRLSELVRLNQVQTGAQRQMRRIVRQKTIMAAVLFFGLGTLTASLAATYGSPLIHRASAFVAIHAH